MKERRKAGLNKVSSDAHLSAPVTNLLELVRGSSVRHLDFFPLDGIMSVDTVKGIKFAIDIRTEELAHLLAVAKETRTCCTSHLHSNYCGKGIDPKTEKNPCTEDKEEDEKLMFLQSNLEPCFEQLRTHYQVTYKSALQSRRSALSTSPDDYWRNKASEDLVASSMAEILASLQTASAVKMAEPYKERIQSLLRQHVEEVFSSVDAQY